MSTFQKILNDAEDAPRKSPFLGKPHNCRCPSMLRETGEELGLTCQRIFCLAYVGCGYPESVSRAMFCQFISEGFNEGLLPIPVKEFCQLLPVVDDTHGKRGTAKCFACSLTQEAIFEMRDFYDRIHPDITRDTLIIHATDKACLVAPDEATLELSDEERAWFELVKSGALSPDAERWDDLVKGDDSF